MTSKELREKRASIHYQMKEVTERDAGEVTKEQWDEFDKWDNEFKELTRRIDQVEAVEKRKAELVAEQEKSEQEKEGQENRKKKPTKEELEEQRSEVFKKYIVRGIQNLTKEERAILGGYEGEKRAQGVGTDAAGGYTVPQGFSNQIEKQMAAFGGMRPADRGTTAVPTP